MSGNRESRQTDVAFMIVGLMFPVVGFEIMNNNIQYLPGDPRGEAWYGIAVLVISIVLGTILFLTGLIRLIQSGQGGRKNDANAEIRSLDESAALASDNSCDIYRR